MPQLTQQELERRIKQLLSRRTQNRQQEGLAGRKRFNRVNLEDIDPRQLGLRSSKYQLTPPVETEVNTSLSEEPEEDFGMPSIDSGEYTDSSTNEGPADIDMPGLNPVQSRMRDDYVTPELKSFGKKIAGKGIGAAAVGSYYGVGLGGVVPSMLNPTYGGAYSLYKAIDAASDAHFRGKTLEDVFKGQGFDLSDSYVQDQITQAQDYDKYSKDPAVMGSYTAPPSEHLDSAVLDAISHDPTWSEKLGLSDIAVDKDRDIDPSEMSALGMDESEIRDFDEAYSAPGRRPGQIENDFSGPLGLNNPNHGPGTPGYEGAEMAIENEMAALEAGVDVFGDNEQGKPASVDQSEMSALGTDKEGVADFDATYGGYNPDGSWNFGGKEEPEGESGPSQDTDYDSVQDDWGGVNDDIGDAEGGGDDGK